MGHRGAVAIAEDEAEGVHQAGRRGCPVEHRTRGDAEAEAVGRLAAVAAVADHDRVRAAGHDEGRGRDDQGEQRAAQRRGDVGRGTKGRKVHRSLLSRFDHCPRTAWARVPKILGSPVRLTRRLKVTTAAPATDGR